MRCEKGFGACGACWALAWIGNGLLCGCVFWSGLTVWVILAEGLDVGLAMAIGDNAGYGLTFLTIWIWWWHPATQCGHEHDDQPSGNISRPPS